MADKNIELVVSVQTKQAEQNVDNLNKKLDQTKQKTDNVNTATSKGASSIGDWGQAFEKVLDEAAKGAGSLGGSLGGVTSTLKTALPIIRNINSTAIAGLKAIKSGLSATGLGLVVVVLGEILSHWKEIVDWTRKAVTGAEEYKITLAGVESTVVTTGEAFNRINDTMKEIQQKHADDLRVYQAEGHTAREILEFKKKQNEEEKRAFENTIRNNAAWTRNNQENRAAIDQTLQAYRNISIELDRQIEVEKRIEAVRKEGKDSGSTTTTNTKIKETTQATLDLWGVLKKLKEEGAGGGYFNWLLNPDTPNVLGTELIEMIRLYGQGIVGFQNEWIKGAIDGNEHMLDLEEAFSKEYIARIEKGAYQEIQTEEEKAAAIGDVERKLWGLRMQVATDNLELAKQMGDNAQIQKYTDDLKVLNAQLETYVAEDTSWIAVLASLDERQDELIQNLIAGLKESKASWRDYVKDLSEVGASVGSIFDSMVEAQKNQIEMDLKMNKISEEQAKERFEQLKGYELAANWINTLAGVANVVASPEGKEGIPGWIIQATQIAAIMAAGFARDRQIRNSYIDNPDTGGSGNGGKAGATPLQIMSDITPSPTMNIPVSSEDTRVYILESDIQKSNNRVKVREDNTTW